jgi:hypothetical protein
MCFLQPAPFEPLCSVIINHKRQVLSKLGVRYAHSPSTTTVSNFPRHFPTVFPLSHAPFPMSALTPQTQPRQSALLLLAVTLAAYITVRASAAPIAHASARARLPSSLAAARAAPRALHAGVGKASDPPGPYGFRTLYFTQALDHFDFWPHSPGNLTTYTQKYLVNDTWWAPGGPIFFYTGNEGPIELFAEVRRFALPLPVFLCGFCPVSSPGTDLI